MTATTVADNETKRDDDNATANDPKCIIAHHLSLLNTGGLAWGERALLDVRSPKSGTGSRNEKRSRGYR